MSGEAPTSIITGSGVCTYQNKDRYEGSFVDGVRKGHGVLTLWSGDRYSGEWDRNQKCGEGEMVYLNRRVIATGTWLNNKPTGIMNVHFKSSGHYEGEFSDS
eukprot:gene30912-38203_t